MSSEKKFMVAIASVPIIYVFTTFYAPLVLLFIESVSTDRGVWIYYDVLFDPDYLSIIGYSAYVAVVATLATLLLSLPVAYYLAFVVEDENKKRALLVSFTVPLLINFLLKTYAFMSILSVFELNNTFSGMMIGMVYEYLPYMLLPVYSTLERINKRLLEAAETLGAKPLQTLRRVILPLSFPGIASGVALVGLMTFTEFVIPAMLGGVYGYTVGYLIWDLFLKYRNWQVGSALAFIITAVSIAVVYVYAKWGETIEI